MAMSGVRIEDECLNAFQSLKTGEKKDKVRAIVMKISDDNTKIVIEKEIPKVSDDSQMEEYYSIIKELPRDCGRYLIFDLRILCKSGQLANKLYGMFWSPEWATVKQRMMYSSSSNTVKDKLQMKLITVTDEDEAKYESFLEAGSK